MDFNVYQEGFATLNKLKKWPVEKNTNKTKLERNCIRERIPSCFAIFFILTSTLSGSNNIAVFELLVSTGSKSQ